MENGCNVKSKDPWHRCVILNVVKRRSLQTPATKARDFRYTGTLAAVLPERVTSAQLRTAALFDPTAFRAFWRVMGAINRLEEVDTDPQVVAGTQTIVRQHRGAPRMAQPSRSLLVSVLAA